MPAAQQAQRLIPEGYTFLNTSTFTSQKVKDMVEDLLEEADNRDPDNFKMYIYNDYFNYAVIELIHAKLSTIHTKIVKKQYEEAYYLLEALQIFQDFCSMWPMLDDGEQTTLTNIAYGACLVTVLRKLKAQNKLDTEHFPSLETLLKRAANWGESMQGIDGSSDYHLVCKGIGQRLFADKSEERQALEKARLEAWIETLDEDDKRECREFLNREPDEDDEDSDEEDGEWWEGDANEDDKDRNYALTRVWKEYKEHLAQVPRFPMRGPPEWDLSKWTEEEKAPFSWKRS